MDPAYTPHYGLVPADTIVGWVGDGDTHCGPCGWEAYHDDATGSMADAIDCEGHPVGPIRAGDRWDADVTCAECGDVIATAAISPAQWRAAALTSPEYLVPAEVLTWPMN